MPCSAGDFPTSRFRPSPTCPIANFIAPSPNSCRKAFSFQQRRQRSRICLQACFDPDHGLFIDREGQATTAPFEIRIGTGGALSRHLPGGTGRSRPSLRKRQQAGSRHSIHFRRGHIGHRTIRPAGSHDLAAARTGPAQEAPKLCKPRSPRIDFPLGSGPRAYFQQRVGGPVRKRAIRKSPSAGGTAGKPEGANPPGMGFDDLPSASR